MRDLSIIVAFSRDHSIIVVPTNFTTYVTDLLFWDLWEFTIIPNQGFGTTMIEWSPEKATMIDRSRMHFACYNFEN